MEWFKALILGLVQGLTEYLPVSSSGHLEIFKQILGIDLPDGQNLMFSVMLHVATVLSTIVVLRKLFFRLCRSFFTFSRDEDFYTVCKILVSCIPVGIVGVFLKDEVEKIFGSGLLVVGICLCVTALLLTFAFYSDFRGGQLRKADSGRRIGWADAFIIGIAQAVAVLPGLSRSGTTIATGILLRDKRGEVATFSFLMVILPILGEGLLDTVKLLGSPASEAGAQMGLMPILIGFAAAFLSGCAACSWMINLVKKGKLLWFAIYCAVMGVICILWWTWTSYRARL